MLLDAVWPRVHVTEDSLVHCVRDIRHALRDEAGSLLRTVARRGYLLDAEVRRECGPSASTPETVPQGHVRPAADRPFLAVLPFRSASDSGEDSWFADGIIEGI